MAAALLLFVLVIAAGTLHRTGLAGVLLLGALSILWLLVNKGVEHQTLVDLGAGHGLTVLDAAGFAGLALVLVQLARVARARGEKDDSSDDERS